MRAKQLIIFLFISLAVFSSCKSKKGIKESRIEAKHKKKEYEKLSAKLNLEIDKKDNIKLYQFIADWLGVPHKDGGCDKHGTDCSCFVNMAYNYAYDKKLPRNSAEMFKQTQRVEPSELKEGDLVFFRIKSSNISHVGIYLKQNWFAHVSSSKGVMINNLGEAYYQKYYAGAGKVN